MIENGTLDASLMDALENKARFWAHGTKATVASIKLDGKEHDIFSDDECLVQVRDRLFVLAQSMWQVEWTFLAVGMSRRAILQLLPSKWRSAAEPLGFAIPNNCVIQLIGEVTAGSFPLLQKLRDEPGRTAKMAADLLVEIVRQKAREDVTDKAISNLSPADFAKLVGEVAADLVKERALK